MALYTDGEINGLEDLQRYESALLDVTSAEHIDLTAKMALAQDEIGAELLTFLLKQSPPDLGVTIFIDQSISNRRQRGVSDVVVTEPLKRWHALKSIELTYQDAYNNQLNDRYQGKWLQYQGRAELAASQLLQVGVGLAWDPIPRAGSPTLQTISGSQPGNTFYVQTTWTNQAGQEGAPSDVIAIETTDGSQLMITAAAAPSNATGWNVYVGLAPDSIFLQNLTPVAVQTNWVLPSSGLTGGNPGGSGQIPDWYVVEKRILQRG